MIIILLALNFFVNYVPLRTDCLYLGERSLNQHNLYLTCQDIARGLYQFFYAIGVYM